MQAYRSYVELFQRSNGGFSEEKCHLFFEQPTSLDPVIYTIKSRDTGHACGQASFVNIAAGNGVIEISHIRFAPALQQTCVATEALYLILEQVLDNPGYRRRRWHCNSLNEKSRRAAQQPGLRLEGNIHNQMIFNGMNRDTT